MKQLYLLIQQTLATAIIAITVFVLSLQTFAQSVILPVLHPTADDYSTLLNQTLHMQDVYGAALFTNGPITIFELRFQRKPGTSPFTNVNINIRISMSTTARNPDNLNSSFASNIGSDESIVFNGNVSLTSSATLSGDAYANPFDIVIPLTVPFTFDPSKGNFLIDYRQYSGSVPGGVLAVTTFGDKGSRLFSYGPDDAVGGADTASQAIQLVTVPASNSDLVIYPNGGAFTNSTKVSIYSKLGAGQVRYTLDGSDPINTSTLYTTTFTISESLTVKTRFFVNGFPASDIYAASFTKANPILFAPGASLFTNSLQIILTNTFGSGVIHYTLDGSAPSATSLLYNGPIQITDGRTISAQLYLNNFAISSVYATNYARVYAFGNDGISANWRQQHFGSGYLTDPRSAADADPDNDGSTNLQEFTANTDPLDPNSGFKIGIRTVPLLAWNTVVDTSYNILRRSSLSSGQFTIIATVKATNGITTFIDTNAGLATSQDYYSIQVAP